MNEFVLTKLEPFFKQFKKVSFKKRETILRPEDTPSSVFYLSEGFVRMYTISREGKEFTPYIFKTGDIFPLLWIFNKTPIDYTLEALSDTALFKVSGEAFLSHIQNDSRLLFQIARYALGRTKNLLERIEHMGLDDARTKVLSLLLICAQRFGKETGEGIEIALPLTHKDIASLIGSARETVSVELEEYEKERLIVYKNHTIIMKDMEKIKRLLG